MKVLVLGGDGMLGHKIFQNLSVRVPDTLCTIRGTVDDEHHRLIPLFHAGGVLEYINAMDIVAVEALLTDLKPDVVVNCIGVIKQRDEAHSDIPSITINALLPHRLAKTCGLWGGRLIHFSTDCVFRGKRGGYTEDDASDAADLYGKTKFLGEVATDNAVTLRTSIIGRELHHLKSLLEWFLSQNHQTVRGFTRAIYSGVTTNHLADVVGDLIEKHPRISGLYQVASQPISKYDLLCLLRTAYHLDIDIVPDGTDECDRSMVGERFHQATGYVCPSWTDLIAQLAADPTPYSSWR